MTGNADDVTLRDLSDRLNYLRNFEERKNQIIKIITEQEKMTPEIMESLDKANTMVELEDIYRPFKPKRQTRATMAVAKGLQPLADVILAQVDKTPLEELAKAYIDPEKKVNSVEDALAGASDIIAETMSDDAELRKVLREFIAKSAFVSSTLVKDKENAGTYSMYENYREQASKMPSHRVLALNRGENEECLKVVVEMNEEKCLEKIERAFIKKNSPREDFLKNT